MRVAIVDYGMGNLGSVRRALVELGVEPMVVDQPSKLDEASRIILPGVGSFADGMRHLRERGFVPEFRRQTQELKKPFLGICLGMQLLADRGTEALDTNEDTTGAGLGLIPGEVVRLDQLGCTLRIPHVGWNDVSIRREGGLFAGVPDKTDFYFVHSFAFRAADAADVIATTEYGVPVVAVVGKGNVLGTQFHPEKSSKAGVRLLKNFLELPC